MRISWIHPGKDQQIKANTMMAMVIMNSIRSQRINFFSVGSRLS